MTTNIITKSYFKVDIELPKGTYDVVDDFINTFEPEVLIYLLGYEVYSLLMEYITATPPEEGEPPVVSPFKALLEGTEYDVDGHKVKWIGLANDQERSLIAYYVYCEYQRNRVTSSQSAGETVSITENSKPASILAKLFSAWNRFEELYGYSGQDKLIPSAYNYLMAHQSDFPKWLFTELKGSINSHDL